MKLCEHCIQAIQSRGESLSVGPLVLSIEEAEEENVCCENVCCDWCGELDDLYECESAGQPDTAE